MLTANLFPFSRWGRRYAKLCPKGLSLFLALPLVSGITWCASAAAQIIPDNTLGAESSAVRQDNINGLPSDLIEGGATRGANLFHSFLEFNIREGRGAYFANPAAIKNILSRVTGGESL